MDVDLFVANNAIRNSVYINDGAGNYRRAVAGLSDLLTATDPSADIIAGVAVLL